MAKMQGLTLESLKKHPALVPLFACIAAGASFALFYSMRCALRSPDVTWSSKRNPEPWNEYKTKQYKFYSPNTDYSKSPVPEY